MMKQSLADLHIYSVRRMRERIGSQILENDVKQANDGNASHQYEKRRITFMRQDLVDNDLKKQRCYQRKNLHKERGK